MVHDNVNELADLYVDGEASPEERRLFEERVKSDPALREEYEWALTLRKGIKALPTEVPEGLEQRIRDSLAGLQNAPSARRRSRFSRMAPALAGTGVAAALVAALAFAWKGLRVEPGADRSEEISVAVDLVNPVEQNAEPILERVITTPSPAGNAADGSVRGLAQSDLWASVRLGDSASLRKNAAAFQRLCAKLNVSFEKYGSDREYLLTGLTPAQWRELSELLGTFGEIESSEALDSWGGEDRQNDENASASLRVSFKDSSVDENNER